VAFLSEMTHTNTHFAYLRNYLDVLLLVFPLCLAMYGIMLKYTYIPDFVNVGSKLTYKQKKLKTDIHETLLQKLDFSSVRLPTKVTLHLSLPYAKNKIIATLTSLIAICFYPWPFYEEHLWNYCTVIDCNISSYRVVSIWYSL